VFLLVPAHAGSPGQRSVKRLLMCVLLLISFIASSSGVMWLVSRNTCKMEISKQSQRSGV